MDIQEIVTRCQLGEKEAFRELLKSVETIIKPAFFAFFFTIFLVEIIKNKKTLKPFLHALIILTFSCITIFPVVYNIEILK